MKEFSKYVGLDVHKETIAVSVAEANGGEVRYLGEVANPDVSPGESRNASPIIVSDNRRGAIVSGGRVGAGAARESVLK
jgi:flagellar basal body P-ring protein FlgI